MDITRVKSCVKIPMYYNVKPILGFAECYTNVAYIIMFDIKFIHKGNPK